MEVLIIKLGATGDALRTTCILKGLKEKYKAHTTWITRQYSYDLLKNNEYIDELIIFDKDLKNKIKKEFDLVINLDDDYEACELASELGKKKLIGAYLDKNNNRVYTKNSEPWFGMGLLRPPSQGGKKKADELKKLNKKTYQQIICDILKIKENPLILDLTEEDFNFAKEFAEKNNIKKGDLVIGLNTSAGQRWQLKSWSIEKTAKLAEKLYKELKAKVILFGGPEEKERNRKILSLVKTPIIDAGCNNSLPQFSALIDLCNILVTSDSLAMQIGVALKKKIVVFFTVTSPMEIELYGLGKKIQPEMDCLVCYKQECNFKPNCVDKIIVEDILNAVKELR